MKKVLLLMSIFALLLLFACDADGPKPESQANDPYSEKAVFEDSNVESVVVEPFELIGYWYDASDFSEGNHETYTFYDDGFDLINSEGILLSGGWTVKNDSLELSFESGLEENYPIMYTGTDTITIDGKGFWRKPKPQDVINGIPLYISYSSDANDILLQKAENLSEQIKTVSKGDESATAEHIIISYDDYLHDFRIETVSFDEDSKFHYKDIVFGLGFLPQHFVVNYSTVIPEGVPYEVISFTDSRGITHSYALGYNGRDGSVNAMKTEVHDRTDTIPMPEGTQTAPINIYSYAEITPEYDDENNYTHVTIDVPTDDFEEAVIKLLYLHKNWSIDGIEQEGAGLNIYLNAIEAYQFNMGSAGGRIRTNEMLLTFAGLWNTRQIKFFVDGKADVSGDHFNFEKSFAVNDRTLKEMHEQS